MSFASAFLDGDDDATHDTHIGKSVQAILQSATPERDVSLSLKETRASNLCFGVPMQWAMGDGVDSKLTRSLLRERILKFEPRLTSLREISLADSEHDNSVTFYLSGLTVTHRGKEVVEIEEKLSRMDQHATEDT